TCKDLIHPRRYVGEPRAVAALDFGAAPAGVADLFQLGHAFGPIDVAFQQLGGEAGAEVAAGGLPLVVFDVELFDPLAEDWNPLVRRRIADSIADVEM